jgi:hypothetical protein
MTGHKDHPSEGTHRHFSWYTTGADGTTPRKRWNLQYYQDIAAWDMQSLYVNMDLDNVPSGTNLVDITGGVTDVNDNKIGLSLVRTATVTDGGAKTFQGSGAKFYTNATRTSGSITNTVNTLEAHQADSSGSGAGEKITNEGTGPGLLVDQNGSGIGVDIDNAGSTHSLRTRNGATIEHVVDTSGNTLTSGYLRVGSTSAPSNTTAGDLTFTRGFATSVDLTGDLTVADEAYGGGWNGSLEVPTKNAVYDKIETLGSGGISASLAIAYATAL